LRETTILVSAAYASLPRRIEMKNPSAMVRRVLVLTAALYAGAAIGQTMYQYMDEAGNTVLSDRPPPAGTPHIIRETVPSGVTQPGLPQVPRPPSVPYPATQAPDTLPGTGPADPGAARDREFVPADEPQTQRRDLQFGVPADEVARQRGDVQQNLSHDEAARQREVVGEGVPEGEDEHSHSVDGLQENVPSDEDAHEREVFRDNQ